MPVFDGHNDVLLRLWTKSSANPADDFLKGDGLGHMDLPRLKQGNMVGGLFAVFAPSDASLPTDDDPNPPYAGALGQAAAARATHAMFDLRDAILAQSAGQIRHCTNAAELKAAVAAGELALVSHIEGAEAIKADLSNLQELYDRGLRSLGPVWSRANVFGAGVPFRFPSSPDTGRGLTPEGEDLVRACNKLRMLVDLSHITERGFWDVARLSTAPLVASHSNVHAICAHSRNLTDQQLKAIGESKGLVGLNFATAFLRPDGRWQVDTAPEILIRHLDHMISIVGEDHVGLGSDFDGCALPSFIKDASGLPLLVAAMQKAGYGDDLIAKVTHQNWLRVLERTWEE